MCLIFSFNLTQTLNLNVEHPLKFLACIMISTHSHQHLTILPHGQLMPMTPTIMDTRMYVTSCSGAAQWLTGQLGAYSTLTFLIHMPESCMVCDVLGATSCIQDGSSTYVRNAGACSQVQV